jgi:hypothetical protein
VIFTFDVSARARAKTGSRCRPPSWWLIRTWIMFSIGDEYRTVRTGRLIELPRPVSFFVAA